ncbi:MAG: zf-HC2 domain-containing protein [Acidobacteria bacterium]|nr:zf-HC2 domain-containing protein [Acidobacteriota bacterium]
MTINPRHIPFARLADMIEGRLPAPEQAETRAHLEACERCTGQAAKLQRITQLMRADDSQDAPRDVLFNTISMFRSRHATEKAPGILRRVLAALNFDSGSQPLAFGVRSGQAATARQLLFKAGDVSVDLRLAQGGEGWTVSGQVLGPCGGGQVEMVRDGETEPAVRAGLNNLCEFVMLPPVAAGIYTLRLRLDDVEVEIPELDLRA